MPASKVGRLTATLAAIFLAPAFIAAQSDPLDPANPARERIWLGGRLIVLDTLPAQVPDAFTFTDQTNVAIDTLINSNIVQITGLGFPTGVAISGTGSPQYRICATSNCSSVVQTWTSASYNVTNNQYLQLRLTSGGVSTLRSATVVVGGVADEWQVTTEGADSTPAAFSFTDQTDVAVATVISSNILQITGINVAVTVTISGSGSPEYRTCSTSNCSSVIQNWTTGSGSISNNQYLQLRQTSAATGNTLRSATVNVGTGSDQWNVTTLTDSQPGSFNFTDTTTAALSTLTNSNILQITGINVAVTVTISGSGSPAYRTCSTFDCSAVIQNWTSGSGSISNNQYLQLRLTSASTSSTARSATVNVGTGADTWYVTTRPPGNATLTTSGSWNVPAGVTSVNVTSTGGGGGGGGGGYANQGGSSLWDTGYDEEWGFYEVWGGWMYGGGGGGGGGGGAASGPTSVSVTPGANIDYTIGAGGSGGGLGTAGGNGGTSAFLSVSGAGGTGGGGGGAPTPGAGGTTGGATGNSGQSCTYWEVYSYSYGLVDEGNECWEDPTGNAAGGGSGQGAGGAGGAGYNLESGSAGSAGSGGKIYITWP